MNIDKAILAGGCFWGMQDLIAKQKGVVSTRVGYTGGQIENPTYEIVKTGQSGHAEAIEVSFNVNETTYANVLNFFFKIHDPTTKNQQGGDIGSQYRSAIFYLTEEQKSTALKAIADVSAKWSSPIVTQVEPAQKFYSAEDYHQNYLIKNPGGYTCHFIRN